MCGIAGILHWGNDKPLKSIIKMCDVMEERGPDDSGYFHSKHITLGHRRLSIIDLSNNAKQPMQSIDKRYNITYNGEIYNYLSLKKVLIQKGYRFFSKSDTEVVMNAYAEWGIDCLNKFNGMFSLAIWDEQKKELFLARDRFGQKPLYYHHGKNGCFNFASQVSALAQNKDFKKNISYEALNCYLAIGYILAPMTFYEDVFKLEPASYMIISNKGKKIIKNRYWEYSDSFRKKTTGDLKSISDNIYNLLDEAVKMRMVSDVPLGAFLSGGIDSSAIVGIMNKYKDDALHTFSVGFSQKSYDESEDAKRIARYFRTNHHNHISDIKNDNSIITEALNSFDEPFSDNSLIPFYEVSKLASDFVKVVLSGDGADELFAGYITHKADIYYKYAKFLPTSLKKFLSTAGSYYANSGGKINWGYKYKQFFHGSMHPKDQAHYLWRIIFHPEQRINILGEKNRELVYETDPFNIFKKYFDMVPDLNDLDRNLYVDAMTWLPDDILVKCDRASMKNSIEVRSPFLDFNLANYAASIPSELKVNRLITKYILKKSLNRLLPKYVLTKKKSGFNAPFGVKSEEESVYDEFQSFNRYVYGEFYN